MNNPQCLSLRTPYVVRLIRAEPSCVVPTVEAHTNRLRTALERIASTSPRAWRRHNCGPDERCIHCRALIDEARDALGWARWPAPTGTPA